MAIVSRTAGSLEKFLEKILESFLRCGSIPTSIPYFQHHFQYPTRTLRQQSIPNKQSLSTPINIHILVRSTFVVFFKRSCKQEQKRKKRQCCQNEEQYQYYRHKEHFHNHLSSSSNNDPTNINEIGKNTSKRYIFNMFTITRTIRIPNTSIRFVRIQLLQSQYWDRLF